MGAGGWGHTHTSNGDYHIHPEGYECTEPGSVRLPLADFMAGVPESLRGALREAGRAAAAMVTVKGGSGDGLHPPVSGPQYPKGTPEYAAYEAELKVELGKFERGEEPYPYRCPSCGQRREQSAQSSTVCNHAFHKTSIASIAVELRGGSAGTAEGSGEPGEVTIRRRGDGLEPPAMHPDGGYMGAATVVNGGQEVNLRDLLTEPWQPALAERLTKTLGRKYLAHQLVSMLPADVALRLVDRVDEVVERRVADEVEKIHHDVDGAVATALARLAESADTKRRELHRERFTGSSRLG